MDYDVEGDDYVEKYLVREKCVAVVVDCDYGSGWSGPRFSPAVVKHKLGVKLFTDEEMKSFDEEHGFLRGPGEYMKRLYVEWVPIGVRFRIHDYDGLETLTRADQEHYPFCVNEGDVIARATRLTEEEEKLADEHNSDDE